MVKQGRVIAMLLVGMLGSAGAAASEIGGFNAGFAKAYPSYRQAMFYLRSDNQAVAALELDGFVEQWNALAARWAGSPPDSYADDSTWAKTLRDIGARGGRALTLLDAGDGKGALEVLSPVRGMLGDLRRRNGIVAFSDCVDELSAAMDIFARYRRELTDLSDRKAVEPVRRHAAVVAYLFERCDRRAPEPIAKDAEFRRLMDGARVSMDRVWTGFETGDARLYRIGIGELRSFERILFLRFG